MHIRTRTRARARARTHSHTHTHHTYIYIFLQILNSGYGEKKGKTLELTIAAWVISAVGAGLLAMSTSIGGGAVSFAVWAVGGMLVCPLNDSAALEQLGRYEVSASTA